MTTGRQAPSTYPTINYTWIGPPSDQAGKAGHDIDGIIMMANQNSHNPIVFWCLEEHKSAYEKKFKDYPNVQVQSVESIYQNDTSPAAIALKNTKEMLLADDKNTVRDRVALKDLFTLYLLMNKGGYIADTNVRPMENASVCLPMQNEFKIAGYNTTSKPDNKMERVNECFLMFSPPGNSAKDREQRIFENYVQVINKWQMPIARGTPIYGSALGNEMISGLLNENPAYLEGEKSEGKKKNNENRSVIDFPDLGIEKHYYNTHKQNPVSAKAPATKEEPVTKIDLEQLKNPKLKADDHRIYADKITTLAKKGPRAKTLAKDLLSKLSKSDRDKVLSHINSNDPTLKKELDSSRVSHFMKAITTPRSCLDKEVDNVTKEKNSSPRLK